MTVASPSIDEMINDVLAHEGGFVNHPNDQGGPTNFGITQATLSRFLERAATVEEVRKLDVDTARDIYQHRYYEKPRINKLPAAIQPFVFDCAVNHGPRRAIKFVQQLCNEYGTGPLVADGLMGPVSKAAAAQCYSGMGDWMLPALVEERIMFYHAIVARNPDQKVFLKGWLRRARSFLQDQE